MHTSQHVWPTGSRVSYLKPVVLYVYRDVRCSRRASLEHSVVRSSANSARQPGSAGSDSQLKHSSRGAR
jgi:hypothetical protein